MFGTRGVIACSQPLASAAGLEVIQQGGNAIDAAVTAAAVLAVVEPSMTSIGGDVFALVYDGPSVHAHSPELDRACRIACRRGPPRGRRPS